MTKILWTDHELNVLRDHYGQTDIHGLMALLPNRSRRTIYHKAWRLNLTLPRGVRSGALLRGVTGPAHRSWKGGPNASQRRSRAKRRPWLTGTTKNEQAIYYRVLLRDRGFCGICGRFIQDPAEVSFDHIRPLSKDGQHVEANLQLAHLRCNAKKRDH